MSSPFGKGGEVQRTERLAMDGHPGLSDRAGLRSPKGGVFDLKILPLSGCAFRLRLKVQGCRPWQPARCCAARPPFAKEGVEIIAVGLLSASVSFAALVHPCTSDTAPTGGRSHHARGDAIGARYSPREFAKSPLTPLLQRGEARRACRGILSSIFWKRGRRPLLHLKQTPFAAFQFQQLPLDFQPATEAGE